MKSTFTIDPSSPSGLSRKGKVAGSLKKNGYYEVKFMKKMYMVHRIIYSLYNNISLESMKGKVIDHIDGNSLNNAPENLRLVTVRQNAQNSHRHRNGKLVGASFANNCQLWVASIEIKGRAYSLGYFKTEIEAHEHYIDFCTLLEE